MSKGLYEALMNESITPKEKTPLLPPPSTINAFLIFCINKINKNYRQKKTELSSVFSVRDWKGSKVRISLAP
jgi:uncharacterized protein YydD (DUF2326 family)